MFEKKELNLYNKFSEKVFHSLLHLFNVFHDAEAELYLVGGCVRDMLLNKSPKDYDLCTNLTPEEVKELLSKDLYEKAYDNVLDEIIFSCYWTFIDTGLKHGTITIHDKQNDLFYEITTYRIDGKYSDGRHPNEVVFTPSLEEDLKRRDFTINSFAYDFYTNKLVMLDESYLTDLEYGIIRTVGNAVERYTEDALRMLRCLRFSAQLNFSIAKETYDALYQCTHLLNKISKERIRDELTKILLSDHPERLELFVLTKLEYFAFDGNCPLREILECQHQNPWHYTDVFHHTMDVIKGVPKTFNLRWAALFHDLGKPKVKELKEGTIDHYHYHGHPDVSEEIAVKLMSLLKFSNDQIEVISKYVRYHDNDLTKCKNSTFKKVLVDIGVENFADFIKLRLADAMAHQLSQGTIYAIDAVDKLYERFNTTKIEQQALKVTDLSVNGYDMMNLGFVGKDIGLVLNYLFEKVLEDANFNKKEKLLEAANEFKNENNN